MARSLFENRFARILARLAVCSMLFSACSFRTNKHFVADVQASGVVSTSGGVVLPLDKVEPLVLQQLRDHGGFALASDDAQPAANATQVKLYLWAEVGSADDGKTNELRLLMEVRPVHDADARFEFSGESLIDPQLEGADAVTHALAAALMTTTRRIHAFCGAWKKQDVQLLRDLRSQDEVIRDSAIDVLAYRGNAAVAEALMSRLNSDNLVVVRKAIGGLVNLKEPRAVPAMIALARGKDLTLVREIIFALSAIGGAEARAYLFTVSHGHDVPAIRVAAEKALEEMNGNEPRIQKPSNGSANP